MLGNPLIVLAGGFGSRLQSILNGLPKPLADINGTPFLLFLLKNWIKNGFNDFIFSLHYESEVIIDFIEKHKCEFADCRFRYVVEPSPMGTGGAISYVIQSIYIENEFFVVNADTWIGGDYTVFNEVVASAIGIVEVEDISRYGSIHVDESGFIVKFDEKLGIKARGYINAGVYKLSKHDFISWNGKPYSIEKEFFSKLIVEKKIKAVRMNSSFIDIGVPEDYFKFCKYIAS
jgi:D-glycero-alpha-D-manno-heptose 1-phosphate guanylyltransferase